MMRLARLLRPLSAFARDERGSIVTLFALMMPVVVGMVGLGVDVMMAQTLRDRLQGAVDQAAVAAAASVDPAQRSATANAVFDANIAGGGELIQRARVTSVTIDPTDQSVEVRGEIVVDTYFARILGLDSWTLRASGNAITSTNLVEIAMALDVTGSMAGSRITGLRNAATSLVNILLPDAAAANRTTIAMVPFNETVNIGTSNPQLGWVLSNTLTWWALGFLPFNGCVAERNSFDLLQDTPPANPNQFPSMQSSLNALCSTARLVLPTNDRTSLLNAINGLNADGGTRIDVGAVWAWRMLSPRWRGRLVSAVVPRDYAADIRKVALIMTDGENNPSGFVSAAQANSILSATCTRMKNAGIDVYTVGFQAPAGADTLLRNCASSISQFYDANNNAQLIAAFQSIARNIGKTRLRR